MHVSVHFNGWGDFPNPRASRPKQLHAHFEGEFVKTKPQRDAVAAGVTPYVACKLLDPGQDAAAAAASLAQVVPLYELEKQGGFNRRRPARRRVRHRAARRSARSSARHDRRRLARQRGRPLATRW